jgi:hypothetical protein
VNIAYDVRDETIAAEGRKRLAEHGEVATMPLRVLAALLFLGGIVYALLSGNWGIGAIVFSLGAVVLGSDRLRVAQSRSDRAIGWVLILSGVFVTVDAMIWMSVGEA